MAIKRSNRRGNLLIFLFIIAIMLSSYSSYSKYTSRNISSSNSKVAVWSIKVNSENIANKSILTNNLQFNIINNSEYIAQNKFAPSSEGYFDIIIDTSETEVAVSYNINIKLESVSSIQGCNLVGYEEITDTNIVPTNIPADLNIVTNNQISGTILLSENSNEQVEKFRIYLKWDDNNQIENTIISNVEVPIEIVVEQCN